MICSSFDFVGVDLSDQYNALTAEEFSILAQEDSNYVPHHHPRYRADLLVLRQVLFSDPQHPFCRCTLEN